MRIEDQRHVVIIGSDSGWLSEMGLRLARRLHRPFLDNCGLIGIARDDGEDLVGAQHRLDRMLAQSTPAVIAISVEDELSMPEQSARDELSRPWVVVVDGSEVSAGLGAVAGADTRIDPSEAVEDDLLDHLAEEFHRARLRA